MKYRRLSLFNAAMAIVSGHAVLVLIWTTWFWIYREPNGFAMLSAPILVLSIVAAYRFGSEAVRYAEIYQRYFNDQAQP